MEMKGRLLVIFLCAAMFSLVTVNANAQLSNISKATGILLKGQKSSAILLKGAKGGVRPSSSIKPPIPIVIPPTIRPGIRPYVDSACFNDPLENAKRELN